MFLFFFLIIDLYFLIPPNNFLEFFDPIAELLITIGIPTKGAKVELETHPVTAEPKIRKISI